MSRKKIKTVSGETVTEEITENEAEKSRIGRGENSETESFGDALTTESEVDDMLGFE